MTITLSAELEEALKAKAQQQGIAPEELALKTLRDQFILAAWDSEPRDDWERRLRALAIEGTPPPPTATFSRDEIYD